jgi:hypothetical protein
VKRKSKPKKKPDLSKAEVYMAEKAKREEMALRKTRPWNFGK